jgi:hypothetical protein
MVLTLAAACGGRSALDSGAAPEGDATSTSGGKSTPGTGKAGQSTGGTATMPEPGTPDPGDPEPGTLDPGTPDPTAPQPNPVPTPDVNCTSDHAKGGMACSMPCVTTCGFYDLGTKGCDCVSGVFVSCHCPRPWDYQGAPTAPTCNTTDGRTHWIDNTPCTDEWAQCIGTDPVSGTNPRGCVCLTDPVNGKLEWTCGSTNKWFLHE